MKYDFAGWVTKNDILCTDGVTIKHDAFKGNHKAKVPLVWNHDHSNPENVLGHMILHNMEEGVYGYGVFNQSPQAQSAKEMIRNGDITAMSIAANRVKKEGTNVVHGNIFEVSLVLAGANAGAVIDTVMAHSEDGLEVIQFQNDFLIHSADDLLDNTIPGGNDVDPKEKDLEHAEKTVGEILDTMNEEQATAMQFVIDSIMKDQGNDTVEQNDDDEGDETMKHNVFDKNSMTGADNSAAILQSANTAIAEAAKSNKGTLKEVLASIEGEDGESLAHGIHGIDQLFPEAHQLDMEPQIWRDEQTGASEILNGTTKSPFSRLKNRYADFTEDEARARGYIKGKEKKEQFFKLFGRETYPQTVYKKQKLDRDDIIDITDFDIVSFIWKEMRIMLIEEIGRAILVGDGRDESSDDKIDEDKIRPIISDVDLYTVKKTFTDENDLIEKIIMGMADYKGSGSPTAFIDRTLLSKVKLLKGTDGRWLNGHVMTDAEFVTSTGVGSVRPTTLMNGKGVLVVNLRDYTVGSTKGGEITTFDDFDIDFNQYKYLIETRISGSMMVPHGAVYFKQEPAAPVLASGITLDKSTASVAVGSTTSLHAEIAPSNVTDKAVTWTSSDTSKATVSGGVITGVAAGSVTITAKTANNKSATATVTVTA